MVEASDIAACGCRARRWRAAGAASWTCALAAGLIALAACDNPPARGPNRARAEPVPRAAPKPPNANAPIRVDVPPANKPPSKPPAAASHLDVAEALRYDPNDPLSNLEAADVLDRGVHGPRRDVRVPRRGCALTGDPRRIWPRAGIAQVAAFGDGFVVAGYTQSRGGDDQVFVVHVTAKGDLEPVATLPVSPKHPTQRTAPPGLAADSSQGVVVAYTDGSGTLYVQSLQVGAAHGGGAAMMIARGVDTRFVPAVSYGRHGALIAYTLGSTPMRSALAQLDPHGRVLSVHDVTPPAMGAAAPVFLDGGSPTTLITADPRDGMSPLARTPLDAEGKPGTGEVLVPVGMLSQPAQLAAAQADFGAYVLYTGLGSAATSAVGLVRVAPKVGTPVAFIKGTAYGPLHVAAVGGKQTLLIAADAPLTAGKQPAHEIRVALIDAHGPGPTLRVAAPTGDATHASLARSAQAGVALAFTAADGVYLTQLSCAAL